MRPAAAGSLADLSLIHLDGRPIGPEVTEEAHCLADLRRLLTDPQYANWCPELRAALADLAVALTATTALAA